MNFIRILLKIIILQLQLHRFLMYISVYQMNIDILIKPKKRMTWSWLSDGSDQRQTTFCYISIELF